MMMADNVIEDSELEFCKNMFEKFGYKELLIDEMIDLYRQGIDDVEVWEQFLERAEVHRINLASW